MQASPPFQPPSSSTYSIPPPPPLNASPPPINKGSLVQTPTLSPPDPASNPNSSPPPSDPIIRPSSPPPPAIPINPPPLPAVLIIPTPSPLPLAHPITPTSSPPLPSPPSPTPITISPSPPPPPPQSQPPPLLPPPIPLSPPPPPPIPSPPPFSPPPPIQSLPPPTFPPPSYSPPPTPTPVDLSPPPPIVVQTPPSLHLSPPDPRTPSTTYPPPPLPSSPPNHLAPRSNAHTPDTPSKPSSSPHHTQNTTFPSNPGSSLSTTSSSESSNSRNNFAAGAIAAGSFAAAIAVVIALVVFILWNRRKRTKALGYSYNPPPNSLSLKPDMFYASKPSVSPPLGNTYPSFRGPGYHPVLPESGGSKLWFTYEELKDITNGFSSENLLGEGGFGCVYKGCLLDGRIVAVKQLKVGGGQGDREFKAEVDIISRVHHRHLVSLVGYCIDEHQRLLVYEYLPNKTLEYHLHGKGLPIMEWSKRVKIAIGSARGLAYLHEDCHPRIIHRDIKSSNILLDNSFEAQVSDFGLAKLTNDAHSHVSTRVMGTFGYMAPEYASSGKLTDRSDVFSFGVVLLELITGRKPVDPSQPLGDESLVEWVRPLLVRALETGECEEFVDPRLENNFVKSEMLLMIEAAAACVRHAASKRPRMVQVVRALDSESDLQGLSNGMKFGQSTVYNSAQYSAEIRLFHGSGLDSDEYSSNYDSSGEHERRM